jgi:hypothetical protein
MTNEANTLDITCIFFIKSKSTLIEEISPNVKGNSS